MDGPRLASTTPRSGINRDGGWAEYVVVPLRCAYQVPASVSDKAAAIIEPFACPFGAVEHAGVDAGDEVMIIDDGAAGLFFTRIVKMRGAPSIVVMSKHRARGELAFALGTDVIVNWRRMGDVRELQPSATYGGFDLVIDAVEAPSTVQDAVCYACPGGCVILYGFRAATTDSFPHREVIMKNLTAYGKTNSPVLWNKALACVGKGLVRLDPLVQHIIRPDGVDDMLQGRQGTEAVKTVIDWA